MTPLIHHATSRISSSACNKQQKLLLLLSNTSSNLLFSNGILRKHFSTAAVKSYHHRNPTTGHNIALSSQHCMANKVSSSLLQNQLLLHITTSCPTTSQYHTSTPLFDKSSESQKGENDKGGASKKQESDAASACSGNQNTEQNTPPPAKTSNDTPPSEQNEKIVDQMKLRMEQVQEKVEDRLPEKLEHLKQQEGETDAQHRKRLAKTFSEKVKEFIKKYGLLGVFVYFAIYFTNIGIFFLMIEYGIFKQGDVTQKLKDWGLGKHFDVDKTLSGKKSSLALAWILTKFTEPFRMMITVSIVPSIYRILVSTRLIREVVKKGPKV